MKAKELLKKVGITLDFDFEVNEIQLDSRLVQKNDIFVALHGSLSDGHDFVASAIEKGAKLIISEREIEGIATIVNADAYHIMIELAYFFYGQPSDHLSFIGVTGTNGKTSITTLLYQCLIKLNKKCCVFGTNGLYYPNGCIALDNTTPDPLILMRCLKKMLDLGIKTVIMEVSSHALILDRVRHVQFDIAIFTNLTQDHLDFHKDMKDYFNAKAILFKNLKSTAAAIINFDDEYGKQLPALTKANVYSYSIHEPSTVQAMNVRLDLYTTSFDIDGYQVKNQLLSMANIYNCLAIYCTMQVLGYRQIEIVELLNQVTCIRGRLEKVYSQDYVAIVDYAHSPGGIINILSFLNELKKNRIITVLGCGGNRDKSKRAIMANLACQHSDIAILTSDNPRMEDPNAILADMTNGLNYSNYYVIVNRREAIKKAIEMARKDDIIAVLGKGHEDYQIIGAKKIHFSDKEEILKAIEGS